MQTFVEAFSHSKANLAKCGNRLLEISVRCCLILMDTPGLGDAFFSKFETFVSVSPIDVMVMVLGCRVLVKPVKT